MRFAIRSFILVIGLALGCAASALAQTQDTIRITNGEWPPFLSEHAPHYGFASHIITEAFALAGVEVEWGFFPWKRSYKLAKEGKWDGSATWWENEERRKVFYFTDPVVPTKVVFFHLKSTEFDWNTYEDLRGINIGGTLQYAYGDEFDAAEAAGTIETNRAPDDKTGLKKLLKGRNTVFPGGLVTTYALIRASFSEEEATLFIHHPRPIAQRPTHLVLSKKVPGNEQMRDRFNEGLKMLKESGKWEQIVADGLAGKYDANQE